MIVDDFRNLQDRCDTFGIYKKTKEPQNTPKSTPQQQKGNALVSPRVFPFC